MRGGHSWVPEELGAAAAVGEEGAGCGAQQQSPGAPAAPGSAHSSAAPLVWIKDLRFRKEPQPLTPRLARGRAEWPPAWLPAGVGVGLSCWTGRSLG